MNMESKKSSDKSEKKVSTNYSFPSNRRNKIMMKIYEDIKATLGWGGRKPDQEGGGKGGENAADTSEQTSSM